MKISEWNSTGGENRFSKHQAPLGDHLLSGQLSSDTKTLRPWKEMAWPWYTAWPVPVHSCISYIFKTALWLAQNCILKIFLLQHVNLWKTKWTFLSKFAMYNIPDFFFLALIIINLSLKNVYKMDMIFKLRVVICWMMSSVSDSSISKTLKVCTKQIQKF